MGDPETTELNQAYLSFRGGETILSAGRQRLVLDNARFVGEGAWRQNQQTFDALTAQFGVKSLEGFGFAKAEPAIGAAGAILRYALETQATADASGRIPHLSPPKRLARGAFLSVDATTLRALEIERTARMCSRTSG